MHRERVLEVLLPPPPFGTMVPLRFGVNSSGPRSPTSSTGWPSAVPPMAWSSSFAVLRKADVIVQEGVPEAIPVEMCHLGWQESLTLLNQLVEPEIPDNP